MLDQEGDVCIEAVYDELSYNGMDKQMITVKDGNKYFFINIDGYKTKEPGKAYEYMGVVENKRILMKESGKYGFLDDDLELKIEPQFDAATAFCENLAAVKKGDKWAVINKKGEFITEYIFDDIAVNSKNVCSKNGIIGVCQSDTWFFINEKGEKVGENTFQKIKAFESEQPCAVELKGKWGFADVTGAIVTECNYEDAKSYVNDYALIKENNLWGYIDLENYKFIPGTFEDAKNMTAKGVAPVSHEGSWTLIELKIMD